MKSFTVSATLLTFYILASSSQLYTDARAQFTGSQDAIVAEIDRIVKEAIECHPPPALSLAVVKNGQVVMTRGYGHTTADKTVAVTPNTQFAVGSITKAFTSYLAAKFSAASEIITLDTPISRFINDFRVAGDYRSQHATLRDLLSHRMTVPADSFNVLTMGYGHDITRTEFARKLAFLISPKSFRSEFVYTNFMYTLAGVVLEELSNGTSWEDQIRQSVFNPLHMIDSGFVNELKDLSNFALPCAIANGKRYDLSTRFFSNYHIIGPAGTIYSSAHDMANWMNLLLSKDGDVVDREAVKMMFQASMVANSVAELSKPTFPVSHEVHDYAVGWLTGTYREYQQISHGGQIGTYSSILWLFPDVNIGIFMSRNGPVIRQDNLFNTILYQVSDLLIGLPPWFKSSDACFPPMPWQGGRPNATEAGFKATDSPLKNGNDHVHTIVDLDRFVGKYVHAVYGDAFIARNASSDVLNFSFGSYGTMELKHRSGSVFDGTLVGRLAFSNAFYIPIVVFTVDSTGSVVSLAFDLVGGARPVRPFYRV